MSWSEVIIDTTIEHLETAQPFNEATKLGGSFGQFLNARDLAADLIHSGSVGDPAKYIFNVNLNGHCEPGHEKRDGYSSDHMSINVSQVGLRE